MAKITTKQLAQYTASQLMNGAKSEVLVNQVAALLVTERRSRDVNEFGRLLEAELDKNGTTQVTITSAHPVDDRIKQRLATALTTNKALFYEVIDPSMIGGVHAATLYSQIDLTISGQLKAFKQSVNKGSN